MHWQSTLRYQDPRTETYLGSPSVVVLPDGALLASHDYFGPRAPADDDGRPFLSSVYRSEDGGATWNSVGHVAGAWWSSLFRHRGDVYLLGTSARYGDVAVRRSTDGGYTWTTPTDGDSGLLFEAGTGEEPPNYHCAPVPVCEHEGRLYRAFEDNRSLDWPRGFEACVVSAPADADLLDADSWTMSERLAYPRDEDPPAWGSLDDQGAGWLEGNVVAGPGGDLWNVLRVNSQPAVDRAAMVRVRDGGERLTFDPDDFVEFPGGMSKFTIRRDPETGLYWTLSNPNRNPDFPNQRNVLALHASADLRTWHHARTLATDDLLSGAESIGNTGFQYADWQFDGDDLCYLVRTAYDGAANYHDANRVTFDRIEQFRELVPDALA